VTAPLRVQAYAKINLALQVLGRRSDGFHEIRTVFQSIDLHDELEVQPSARLELECLSLPDVPPDDNLVMKAARALCEAAKPGCGARLILRKRIPTGAGLGGGSSDAAAALIALSRFWGLSPAAAQLHDLASRLGSDVPFFLQGGTGLGIGRGEEVYPLPDFPESCLAVVFPGVHVNTAEAYRRLGLGLTSAASAHKMLGFCDRLADSRDVTAGVFNDFETSILPAYPAIREAKEFLKSRGAMATLLSGSGSSVFGFFLDEESTLAVSRAAVPDTWRVFPAKTLPRAAYVRRMFG
jgi:4-diphosphocytidyl-2-C-methyl-D-erythritol kinase